MKLLLTASGITTPELKQAFVDMTDGKTNLRVALIPTAGDPIEWVVDPSDPKRSTAKLLRESLVSPDMEKSRWYLGYKEGGFNVVIADLKEKPETVREKLQNVDIIDVGGGDVNYLLDWVRKSKLDSYLKEILDKNVLYTGGSAGSARVSVVALSLGICS